MDALLHCTFPFPYQLACTSSASCRLSSTPWHLQRGHELRPVVSHLKGIQSLADTSIDLGSLSHLVDALLMEHMGALDKLSYKFLGTVLL